MIISKELSLFDIEFILNNTPPNKLQHILQKLSFYQTYTLLKDLTINSNSYILNNPPTFLELIIATQSSSLHSKILLNTSSLTQDQLFKICYLIPIYRCLPILNNITIHTLVKYSDYINKFLLSLIFQTRRSFEILLIIQSIKDVNIIFNNLLDLPVPTFAQVIGFFNSELAENIHNVHISYVQKNFLSSLLNNYGIERLSQLGHIIPPAIFIIMHGLSETQYIIEDNFDILDKNTQTQIFKMIDAKKIYELIYNNFENHHFLITQKEIPEFENYLLKDNQLINIVRNSNISYKLFMNNLKTLKTNLIIRKKLNKKIKFKKSHIKKMFFNYFASKYLPSKKIQQNNSNN